MLFPLPLFTRAEPHSALPAGGESYRGGGIRS
jgi:hypothetical protein